MNILILNGSPAGDNSITLQTVLYLEKRFPEHRYELLNVGQRIRALEKDLRPALEQLQRAELLLFCYPVYTFLVPAQLHRFLELVKASGAELRGKFAAQISTSKHFYDITAHAFIRENCADLGLRYLEGLSADMEDLLSKKGRKEAEDFFRHVLWAAENGVETPCRLPAIPAQQLTTATVPADEGPHRDPHRVVIVADLEEGNERLRALIRRFQVLAPFRCTVVNLREFSFAGGCLGCFHCAADGTCVYKDGFDKLLREQIQKGDATVYAFSIRDHSMGSRFKLYDDRQFCNGHRTVTMGKPVAYLVDGYLSAEPNLQTLIEGRAQVGGNFLAGVACSEGDADRQTEALARNLAYAMEKNYQQPANFYGVGGMKIFRDLIYTMQGLMREDHRFYKKHGFYDFPQKKRVRIAAMYLVGAMMNSKKLSKKLGANMTRGMLMPYQSALKKAEARKE